MRASVFPAPRVLYILTCSSLESVASWSCAWGREGVDGWTDIRGECVCVCVCVCVCEGGGGGGGGGGGVGADKQYKESIITGP